VSETIGSNENHAVAAISSLALCTQQDTECIGDIRSGSSYRRDYRSLGGSILDQPILRQRQKRRDGSSLGRHQEIRTGKGGDGSTAGDPSWIETSYKLGSDDAIDCDTVLLEGFRQHQQRNYHEQEEHY